MSQDVPAGKVLAAEAGIAGNVEAWSWTTAYFSSHWTTPVSETVATFKTSLGVPLRAGLLRLTGQDAAVEISSPDPILKTSEVLEDFVIQHNEAIMYRGPAVVKDTVRSGTGSVYSLTLDERCFDSAYIRRLQTADTRKGFRELIQAWQSKWRVLPGFKVAVADIRTFLLDLRNWLEQVEMGLVLFPALQREQRERALLDELCPEVIPVLDELFARFEQVAQGLGEELRQSHRSYVQRELHPLVLCAPFASRCYRKPLGYAGDFEMVNMMLRDPREGSSLFARVFNVWLLSQGSAVAHRNRVRHLKRRLIEETARVMRNGRTARILNVGCGAAAEVQEFLAESEVANSAHLVLMDFSQEALDCTGRALRQVQESCGTQASVDLVRRSVQQLLKDGLRAGAGKTTPAYDLVYCAGLFDYLPDRTCSLLLKFFWQLTNHGGAIIATNVTPESPNRASLDLILEWHLVYRTAEQVRQLWPRELPDGELRVSADPHTFTNVWLEVRKEG